MGRTRHEATHRRPAKTDINDDGGSGPTVAELLGELNPIRKAARKSSNDSSGSTAPHRWSSDNQNNPHYDRKVPTAADEVEMGLLMLILEYAVAILFDKLDEAHNLLLELLQTVLLYDEPFVERVVIYFAKAMSSYDVARS